VLCFFCSAVAQLIITARSDAVNTELRQVLFLAPPVCGFLFVYEISRKPLNGFAPNSRGRRVWSLARMSLKVKGKGEGHQGQKRHFSALSAFGLFGIASSASIVTARE